MQLHLVALGALLSQPGFHVVRKQRRSLDSWLWLPSFQCFSKLDCTEGNAAHLPEPYSQTTPWGNSDGTYVCRSGLSASSDRQSSDPNRWRSPQFQIIGRSLNPLSHLLIVPETQRHSTAPAPLVIFPNLQLLQQQGHFDSRQAISKVVLSDIHAVNRRPNLDLPRQHHNLDLHVSWSIGSNKSQINNRE